MPQSGRFDLLVQELDRLREHLLPSKFSPLGIYTDQQLTQVIAYRVLTHAEIEAYLEDRVWEVVLDSIKVWKSEGKSSRTLLSLMGFCGFLLDAPPSTLNPSKGNKTVPDEKLKIDKKIDRTATSFKKVIDGNHGLKESNILALLLPIGIDNDSIDSAWLSTMNTFGTQRGVAAHTSASSYKASQPPDPKIELDTVNEVLIGLKTIDRLVNDLM